MAIENFIRRRQRLIVGGHAVSVGQPTLSTVVLAVGLYAHEIAAARQVYAESEAAEAPHGDPIAAALELAASDRARLTTVLETCVEGDLAGAIAAGGGADLLRAAIGIMDIRRVMREGLDLGKVEDAAQGDPWEPVGIPALERSVVLLAERFHCAPHDVCEWPFEEYLDVLAVLSAEAGEPVGTGQMMGPGNLTPGGGYFRAPKAEA